MAEESSEEVLTTGAEGVRSLKAKRTDLAKPEKLVD